MFDNHPVMETNELILSPYALETRWNKPIEFLIIIFQDMLDFPLSRCENYNCAILFRPIHVSEDES